jgi:hypothetical protein
MKARRKNNISGNSDEREMTAWGEDCSGVFDDVASMEDRLSGISEEDINNANEIGFDRMT